MPTVYLDSSVLIAYLYTEFDQPERFDQVNRLFEAIRSGSVSSVVSFYALPELYDHVSRHYAQDKLDDAFRASLVELFSAPIIIAPFLNRAEFDRLRQQITITDPEDARHTAVALSRKCDAIITFDHHFEQVGHLIRVYTPAEFLATLKPREGTLDVG